MAGLRDQKKQAVRKAIYDTATLLFEREGYDAVSVGRITAEVGIAKGTFFNHFPAKADILAAWYSDLVKRALVPADPGLPLLERILHLNRQTGRQIRQNPELWQAKNAEAPRTPSLQAVEREADAGFVAAVTRELERLPDHPADLPPPRMIADLVLALATGTWREAQVTGCLDNADRLFETRLAVLLDGLGLAGTS